MYSTVHISRKHSPKRQSAEVQKTFAMRLYVGTFQSVSTIVFLDSPNAKRVLSYIKPERLRRLFFEVITRVQEQSYGEVMGEPLFKPIARPLCNNSYRE